MNASFAVVTVELPDRHGVLVRFPGGADTLDTGDESGTFVRVLARRAHPSGGASIELPQVGELGVVIQVADGPLVWLGSVHWQDRNWVDPLPLLEMHRHTSGIRRQVRANGDMQLDHPSGLRITVAEAQGALSELGRNGDAVVPPQGPVDIEIEHPAGWNMHLDNDGAFTLAFPAGGTLAVDKDGNLSAKDFAKMEFQDGNARFAMEGLVDWIKTHKHAGVQTGVGQTGVPTTTPGADALSPSTFKGPHA